MMNLARRHDPGLRHHGKDAARLRLVARIIGQWLSERLGQPIVVDNRPGAGGNIAVETVANAPADDCAREVAKSFAGGSP
jgi:hypothetical protein